MSVLRGQIADKLTRLEEIRDDMRQKLVAKGVEATDHNFADFASDVESIPTGGGEDEWVRPAEWPQYTDEMLEDNEVMYCTIEMIEKPYVAMEFLSTGGVTIQYGDLVDGNFTAIETETVESGNGKKYSKIFDTTLYPNRDYICCKITPTSGHITEQRFSRRTKITESSGNIYEDGAQPVLEVFARLPYATISYTDSYICPYALFTTRSATFVDMAFNIRTGFNTSRHGETAIENLKLDNIDCTDWRNADNAFACWNLRWLYLDLKNTQPLTNMAGMFATSKLTELDLSFLDTSDVTDMSYMFYQCSSLKFVDISSFDTSSVTNMSCMFGECVNLEQLDVSLFDTSSVTNMNSMFKACNNLKSIDLSKFDTSNVTDMSSMFNGLRACRYLDLSSFNTEKVTTMSSMFSSSPGLNKLVLPDGLTHTAFDHTWTSSADVPLMAREKNFGWQATTCEAPINDFFSIPKSFDMQSAYRFGHDGILNVINALPEVSSTQTLTLGSAIKAYVSAEEIAIAEEKGWTVV